MLGICFALQPNFREHLLSHFWVHSIAIQRNFFGNVVAAYKVSVAGEVAAIARNTLSATGPE
jgi:hypothetical protein